jgi:hypothetical protein
MNPNRFLLPGGFGASSASGQANGGGSGGGSGNFLFDIIRVSIEHGVAEDTAWVLMKGGVLELQSVFEFTSLSAPLKSTPPLEL